jgi:XTP/dITP diphosphohydrolase
LRLWVATGNSNKYGELRDTVAMLGLPVEVLPLETVAVDESGVSYYQNAFKKAISGARLRRESIVLADDSGLEIPALGGLPGVHSARFSWKGSTGCRALQAVLSERGIVTAPARFICCIVGFLPTSPLCISAVGTVSGTIHAEARGPGGFGYDPLFVPDDESETFAEMPGKHKAVISHRAKAFVAFMGMLGGVTPGMP